MAKKKQFDSALQVSDTVIKGIIAVLIMKMHNALCCLQQTTGYVPYFKSSDGTLIWIDVRHRGRSTFGEYPTITYKVEGKEPIYIWWNRHYNDKLDILASPTPSLDDLHEITEAFNKEQSQWNDTFDSLRNLINEINTLENSDKNE